MEASCWEWCSRKREEPGFLTTVPATDCCLWSFSWERKVNAYSLKPLCATEKNHSDPPPSPTIPFRYFLEVHLTKLYYHRATATASCTIPHSSQYTSSHLALTTVASQSSLTKFTVVNIIVEQTHGDVPTSGSVYCSVAGLPAFQIVPVDISIWCLNHSHSKVPCKKDT